MALDNECMIRSLRSLDLLLLPLRQRERLTEQSVTLDQLDPRGASGPLLSMARQRMMSTQRSFFWSAEERGRLGAVVQGRARSGPNAWEVPHLWAGKSTVLPVAALLEQVPAEAARHGARRVFLRLLADSPYVESARRAGFVPAYQETLLTREGHPSANAQTGTVRRRLHIDDAALFRAFSIAAPATVRAAVGLTLEEWRDAQERCNRNAGEWVFEDFARAASGMAQVWACKNATHVRLIAGTSESLGPLLARALPADDVQRINVVVPDFLPHLHTQAAALGFAPAQQYVVMVKSVTVLMREVAFAPASI